MKYRKNNQSLQSKICFSLLCTNTKSAKYNHKFSAPTDNNDGFTLIEVIVAFVMVGILAAIALPSWLGFIKQQRIIKANNAVLAAIQEAQQEAKKKKLSYSVSFKVDSVDNNLPKFVVHPDSEKASDISDTPNNKRWKILGEDLGIKADQITFLTNLDGKNTVAATVNTKPSYLNTAQTITFDYMGTLSPIPTFKTKPADSTKDPELKIVVTGSIPKNSASTTGVKRCVIIRSLLGSMVTEKGDKDDNKCK